MASEVWWLIRDKRIQELQYYHSAMMTMKDTNETGGAPSSNTLQHASSPGELSQRFTNPHHQTHPIDSQNVCFWPQIEVLVIKSPTCQILARSRQMAKKLRQKDFP